MYGCPSWCNIQYLLDKLENCYGQLLEERKYQRDQIKKKISDLKEIQKAHKLYEC